MGCLPAGGARIRLHIRCTFRSAGPSTSTPLLLTLRTPATLRIRTLILQYDDLAVCYFHGTRRHRLPQALCVIEVNIPQSLFLVDFTSSNRAEILERRLEQFLSDALRRVRMFEERGLRACGGLNGGFCLSLGLC